MANRLTSMFTPQTTRRIALTVFVTFTSLTMQPLQAAIQLPQGQG